MAYTMRMLNLLLSKNAYNETGDLALRAYNPSTYTQSNRKNNEHALAIFD
jgi:hypothetical protein